MDVIVVGLGAMGSATVHQLARRGVEVLGIDRHSPPHSFGSSHGETRITRRLTLEGTEYVPLAVRSHEWWRRIEAETGASVLTECGVLSLSDLAVDPGAFAVHERAAAAFGIDYELLDAAALRDRFPQFRVETSRVGLLEPGGGFVRPEAAISAQLDLAKRYGARLPSRGTGPRGRGHGVGRHRPHRRGHVHRRPGRAVRGWLAGGPARRSRPRPALRCLPPGPALVSSSRLRAGLRPRASSHLHLGRGEPPGGVLLRVPVHRRRDAQGGHGQLNHRTPGPDQLDRTVAPRRLPPSTGA